jgi:hypothetical protein
MKKAFVIFLVILAGLFLSVSVHAFQSFPDTGQTKCYNNSAEIPCPSPGQPFYGQDAQYQPRLPRSYTKLGNGGTLLPDSAAHVDNGGQWIMTRDNVTGLIWELKTNANRNHTYNRSNAQDQFIAGLNSAVFGGFSNWRLPDIKELSSLINAAGPPWIDFSWFPKNVSSSYWSSTTAAGSTGYAWRVGFHYGGVSDEYNSNTYVRAVRAAPPPQPSFVDHGDGTVTDTATGLMWQKCSYGQTWSNGQCTGSATTLTWQQALEAAETLTWPQNGYTDWRLPNRNELHSLVDFSRYDPAIDPVFASVSSVYWSSTANAYVTDFAWRVGFNVGGVGDFLMSDSVYVRAVRAGQSVIGEFGSLTVNSTGENRVPITANPSTYGGTTNYAKTNIPNDTQITLIAPTTIGEAMFNSWSGCDSTNQLTRTCTVTMNGNKNVTVQYGDAKPTTLPGVIILLLDEE